MTQDSNLLGKFLSPEALHGVGGHASDAHGNRFVNELGRPDYVIGDMWKKKPPFPDAR